MGRTGLGHDKETPRMTTDPDNIRAVSAAVAMKRGFGRIDRRASRE